ncbi:MAG: peptide deformylase [Thermovirgaceae bacterium]|jgi:peptide deformylase|nr:peptide deformylase [Synergistales bacterium]MDI9391882.1 peptide deformylase [Synergistota bacterium]MDY0179437.1 peptide deformylase [Synergistaceae bacterium]HRW87989.1 peptide deformylase [Thermovirgaceae bacterium]MDD3830690.1 peptide deformylase [Synergistales bacterium]
MSVRTIREYPDPVLRGRAEDVTDFGEELQSLLKDMWETMEKNDGVGLAAPQIGVNLRVAVIGWRDRKIVLVNPVVVEHDGEEILEEGCLSAPGFYEKVARPERVVVEAKNEKGQPFRIEEKGFLARAMMHEIDHLEGRLFFDRISPLKRKFLKRKLEKRVEK